MKKNRYQILNIFQSSIPIHFIHLFGGYRCVDICQTINILMHDLLSEISCKGVLSGQQV